MKLARTEDKLTHTAVLFTTIFGASAIFLLLAIPMLGGRIYTWGDLSNLHLPFRYFYKQCLAAGDSFLWMPDIFCGFYLHGEGQAGLLHPLHLALYAALPLAVAFNLELLLAYPVLFSGLYLFLRRWPVSRAAAVFGALVFAFSGFNLMHYMHLNVVAGVAHIPWLLLAIDLAMRGHAPRQVRAGRLLVGLLTASQLLVSHPQFILYSAMAEIWYVTLLTWRQRRWTGLAWLGTAKFGGILIGALQLLPTLEAAAASPTLTPGYSYSFSLHPLNLLQLAGPYLFGMRDRFFGDGNNEELAVYNGAVPLLLFVLVVWRWRRLVTVRPLALGSAALGILAAVLALGRYGYLYRLLAHLPLFGSFRCPCRHIVLVHLAMGITAALGLDDITRAARTSAGRGWRRDWPLLSVSLVSIAIAVGALALWGVAGPGGRRLAAANLGQPAHIAAGALLTTAATFLLAAARRGSRLALVGAVLFAAGDIGVYGLAWVWRSPVVRLANFAPEMPQPPRPTRNRLFFYDWYHSNAPVLCGVRLAHGYASLPPQRELQERPDLFMQLAGVEWALPAPDAAWQHIPHPTPRARLVARAQVSKDVCHDAHGLELASVVLLAEPVDLPPGEPGNVHLVLDRPGRIRLVTVAPSRQVLVLSESYHQGWRAYVDGRPTRALRAYGDFLACVVEAGNHEVEFRFAPRSLRLGAWLAVVGAALLTFACLSLGGEPSERPISRSGQPP